MVKGKKSSLNKERNPFPFDIQKKMINNSTKIPTEILSFPTGFISDWIEILRKKNYEPTIIVAGSDRYNDYSNMIKRTQDFLDTDIKVFQIPRTEKDVSATKARNAIKNNDKLTNLLPKSVIKMVPDLKKIYG